MVDRDKAQKRLSDLDEVALGNPTRGIVPVFVAVGFSGDSVEGMTPSPDYRHQSWPSINAQYDTRRLTFMIESHWKAG